MPRANWRDRARDALSSPVTPTERVVLTSLVLFSDNQGVAWPSRATIAKELGLPVGSVRNALSSLRRHGYIETRPPAKGRPYWHHVIQLRWSEVASDREG